MIWTDEQTKKLRSLWHDGYSCSEIACRIGGITRNAVIGKCARLGLAGRKVLVRKPNEPKPRKVRPKPFIFSPNASKSIPRDGLPIPSPAETDIPRVSTLELEADHCRWPCTSDPLKTSPYAPQFCGEKQVPGLPYCEPHCRRAFMPPQPRRREALMPVPAEPVPELEAA